MAAAKAAEFARSGDSDALKYILAEESRLATIYNQAVGMAPAAERYTRELAQLAFGVSACAASNPHIERLDRAAVAVLHPPQGAARAVGLIEDGLKLRSTSRKELGVSPSSHSSMKTGTVSWTRPRPSVFLARRSCSGAPRGRRRL